MRNIILFDDETREQLLPLTYTRPVSEIRVGILTISEKWELRLGGKSSWITSEYLSGKYPITIAKDNLVINGSVLPNDQLVKLVSGLNENEALMSDGDLVAARIPGHEFDALIDGTFGDEISGYGLRETPVTKLTAPWEVFTKCGEEIVKDYRAMTLGHRSTGLSDTNRVIGDHGVYVAPGASAEFSIFNTTNGPIYLGPDSQVMEGCVIRGPFALGDHAVVKMGAKIYGPTSIGPYSKVGGELNNVSFQGYSNKGHDGFLGNAAVGEWCNFGADSNNSNLKNTYSEVRLWNYPEKRFASTGLQFCGLIMGDHSKCGINTMFNTGTVVGVSSNIYGAGYPRNFVPSFTWGGPQGMKEYRTDKAYETARAMMTRRNVEFSTDDENILNEVFRLSEEFRKGM